MRALSRPVPHTALVFAEALAAWIITVQRMRAMEAGPDTDLGGLGWYVGIWVTMTAAMLLPSAAPVVLLFARAWSERTRGAALVPAADAAAVRARRHEPGPDGRRGGGDLVEMPGSVPGLTQPDRAARGMSMH